MSLSAQPAGSAPPSSPTCDDLGLSSTVCLENLEINEKW